MLSKKKMLQQRFRTLKRRQNILKESERRRRKQIRGLRLHNRLRLDLQQYKTVREQKRAEWKKKMKARRETAKLNRTLRRRRKK